MQHEGNEFLVDQVIRGAKDLPIGELVALGEADKSIPCDSPDCYRCSQFSIKEARPHASRKPAVHFQNLEGQNVAFADCFDLILIVSTSNKSAAIVESILILRSPLLSSRVEDGRRMLRLDRCRSVRCDEM